MLSCVVAGCVLGVFAAGVDVATLPKAELDRGGLTFDFGKVSDRWYSGSNVATNYFAGFAWTPCPERFQLDKVDLPEDSPIRKAVLGKTKWEVDGLRAKAVTTPDLLETCQGKAKVANHMISECYLYSQLPDDRGGEYRLSFRYRCRNTVMGSREAYWVYGYADKPGGRWSGAYWHPLSDCDGRAQEQVVKVRVPVGKSSIKFMFEFGGIGEFEILDMTLSRFESPKTPVSLRCAIPDLLDGVFALSKGQVGLYLLEWRANDDTKWDAKRLRIRIRLPKDISLRACNFADLVPTAKTIRADGGEEWCLEVRHGMGRFLSDIPKRGVFSRHEPFQLLLEPKAGCGAAGEGTVVVESDGKPVSNVERIAFRVIPHIRVNAPKRLYSGMNVGMCVFDFHDRAAQDDYAQMMADAGMRTIHWGKWMSPPGCDDGAIPALRKAGFTKLIPYDCSLSDGYIVGDGDMRPKNEKFVGDVNFVQIESASCPIAIYTEKPYAKAYFEKKLPKILAGGDGMWANWEPYFFAGHGCWCDRCREAFAAYSGLPSNEVVRAWPAEMKKGKYEDLYIEFRGKEHAKVVKTIDKWVRKYTGGERSMGFMPGVAWCEMSTEWRSRVNAKRGDRHPREQNIREYAADLKWLEPWGPYPRWNTVESYRYSKWKHLVYWVAAKDIREQLEREYPATARPNLVAYPFSKMGELWLTQPEQLSMAYDAFYFNGWRSVVPYFFPMGYDARYWAAISEATERAAKYEDWLLDGTRVDSSVAVTPVAEYAMPCSEVTFYVPAATNVSCLQTAAYRLNGTTIVATLNYWEKGEAFFDLTVRDLPAGDYAVVDEKGVLYAKSSERPYWSAADLVAGRVRLAVGAARTRVFEIRPADAMARAGVTACITPVRMSEIFAARRADLAREAEIDRADETAKRAAGCHAPET